jgi:uncharacterized protein YutE (UPF0331/DUF86 family)/predicted nucleotidyltransferase
MLEGEILHGGESTAEILRRILFKYAGIKLAYLFGIHARGSPKPLSDIDIAVYTDDPSVLLDVSAEISRELGIPEDRVSIVDLRVLDPVLILRIAREGIEVVNRGVNISNLVPSEVVEVRELERSMSRIWLRGDPLDVEIVRDIINRILEDARDLKELLSMGYESVVSNKFLRRSFERILQTLIEGCIDLLRRVIAGLNLGVASYYKDYIDIAERNNVISRDTAAKLRELVPVRHVLVHGYRRVDYSKLWSLAEEITSLSNPLISEVKKYVKERVGESVD